MKDISEIEITVPGISALKDFCRRHSVLLKACLKYSGAFLLFSTVLAVFLLFAYNVYGFLTGDDGYRVPLGGNMTNYAAGFIRRGLFGEILYLMNAVFQPFVSVLLISSFSFIFIFYLLISGMRRLHAGLPYIIAIVLSPSLVLMYCSSEFFRTDGILMALNFSASCIILHLLFRRRDIAGKCSAVPADSCHVQSFAGMLFIDAVLFILLSASALIHELSITLLPPVLLLFLVYARRVHRTMHCVTVAVLLIIIYAVMMTFFKFQDAKTIADSWSGVFSSYDGSPEMWKHNIPRGMAAVADREYAMFFLHQSSHSLPDFFFMNLLTAIAEPFIILLLSGIRIFHSSSSRFRALRWVIASSCLSPLCLSFVAYDYGRWFSITAIQLAVYVLLISHHAGRIYRIKKTSESSQKIISAAKMFLALAIMVHFSDFMLIWSGSFYTRNDTDSLLEETKKAVTCLPELGELTQKLLSGDLIMTP